MILDIRSKNLRERFREMLEKIRFFIEFRMLQPVRFSFCVLYIWLIVCGVLREILPMQHIMSGGMIIYVCWFVIFLVRTGIANAINKFPNYIEKKVSTDIIIEDMVKIRNRAYNKVLVKLKFKTSEGKTYYGKYICDPLYFETYLKSKLYRKMDMDISVWHNKNSKKYFIDVRNVMKKVAGVEREDYKKDLLKGHATDINLIQLIMLLLLFINILLIIISIVDGNVGRVFFLICSFMIISFAIYLKAKKS